MGVMIELLGLLETQLVGNFGFISEDMLAEDLGNLATLKAGKLMDVFKQSGHETRHGGRSESDPRNKFQQWALGKDSEIITLDKLKKPNQIKKACTDENVLGAVFYIDDKAFMAMNGQYFQANDTLIVQTDFSKIDNILDRKDIEKGNKEEWDSTERKYKTVFKKGGAAMRASEFAQLVTELIGQFTALEKDIKVKFIKQDQELFKKRRDRNHNPAPTAVSNHDAKQELKVRLAKFKNEKLMKVETKEELIEILKKTKLLKSFSFNGHNYVAISKGYEDSFFALMQGKTASINYEADRKENDYNTLKITYKLNGMSLEVVDAK